MGKQIEIKNLKDNARWKDQIVEYLLTHGHGPRGEWCDTITLSKYFETNDLMMHYILCEALAEEGRLEFKSKIDAGQAMAILDNSNPFISRILVRASMTALKERNDTIKANLDEANLKNIRPAIIRANIALVIALLGFLFNIWKSNCNVNIDKKEKFDIKKTLNKSQLITITKDNSHKKITNTKKDTIFKINK